MKRIVIAALVFDLSALALGCGGAAAGTQPHAMGATEHQAAATEEERLSKGHGEQFDPSASTTVKECSPARAGTVCWISETNPTSEHARDSGRHRELAAQHRAASEALRNAESTACSGIPEADRDISPFSHREDIRSVSPLREEVTVGRAASYRNAGAEVVFRAVPGMTVEWLQRVLDCHLARNAAIGHEAAAAEMPYCPLTLRGVQARVRSVGDGFAVAIRADDEETSKEIRKRAESLRSTAASAQ